MEKKRTVLIAWFSDVASTARAFESYLKVRNDERSVSVLWSKNFGQIRDWIQDKCVNLLVVWSLDPAMDLLELRDLQVEDLPPILVLSPRNVEPSEAECSCRKVLPDAKFTTIPAWDAMKAEYLAGEVEKLLAV